MTVNRWRLAVEGKVLDVPCVCVQRQAEASWQAHKCLCKARSVIIIALLQKRLFLDSPSYTKTIALSPVSPNLFNIAGGKRGSLVREVTWTTTSLIEKTWTWVAKTTNIQDQDRNDELSTKSHYPTYFCYILASSSQFAVFLDPKSTDCEFRRRRWIDIDFKYEQYIELVIDESTIQYCWSIPSSSVCWLSILVAALSCTVWWRSPCVAVAKVAAWSVTAESIFWVGEQQKHPCAIITLLPKTTRIWLHVIGPPAFQHATLKNWDRPRDEATEMILPCTLSQADWSAELHMICAHACVCNAWGWGRGL